MVRFKKDEANLKYQFQVINIKLQTEKEGVEKEEAYSNLIKKMKTGKIHSSVGSNLHMIIYNFYQRVLPDSDFKYLYGSLGKGIYFEEEMIPSINIEESKNEYLKTNKNQILEPKIAEYIFIPKIHKFIYIKTAGISIKDVQSFLKTSLAKVVDKGDIVEVEIVKDPKITDEILRAFEIHSLDYSISYTNEDPTKSVERLLDNRLKKIYAGKLNVKLDADNKGSFNMQEPDELIEGGIKLAEQNGRINKVVMTRNKGEKRITLSNKESPRTFTVEATEENYREMILRRITNLFSGLI